MRNLETQSDRRGDGHNVKSRAIPAAAPVSRASYVVFPFRLIKAIIDLFRPGIYPDFQDDI
jgi:hypothetical protein